MKISIPDFLDLLQVQDDTIIIPSSPTLEKKVFEKEIKKPLVNFGGEWNKSLHGFTFPFDPTISLLKLKAGATLKLRSKFHYFDTPLELAGGLIHFAEENHFKIYDLPRDAKILEPGAGQGNLLKKLNVERFTNIHHCEMMEENRMVLDRVISKYNIPSTLVAEDFLTLDKPGYYDLIFANPPFKHEKKHLAHMLKLLKPGGTILSITSPKIYNDDDFFVNKIEKGGGDWFVREIESDPEDPIFEGTATGCCFLVIRKKMVEVSTPPALQTKSALKPTQRPPIAEPRLEVKRGQELCLQGSLF
jgi:SAM-dependent methyltransferase